MLRRSGPDRASNQAGQGAVREFAALLPWQFFSRALSEAGNSLVTNANLISKTYFPRLIVPADARRAAAAVAARRHGSGGVMGRLTADGAEPFHADPHADQAACGRALINL